MHESPRKNKYWRKELTSAGNAADFGNRDRSFRQHALYFAPAKSPGFTGAG